MLSQGVAWVGRVSFLFALFFSFVTIVGQYAYWLANADWVPIDVTQGLAAFGLGPMHSRLRGLDLILSYVDEAAFSIVSAAVGVVSFILMSRLAQWKRL